MAKKKEEIKEFNADQEIEVAPTLDSKAYALVQVKGVYKVVSFNFDMNTKTMSDVEVHATHENQFDAGDDLILTMEEEIYS